HERHALGGLRPRQGPALRALHGPLRLRAVRRPGRQQEARRQPEDAAVAADVIAVAPRSGPPSFPNSGLGTHSPELPFRGKWTAQGRETEFRGRAFPNRSLGTRKDAAVAADVIAVGPRSQTLFGNALPRNSVSRDRGGAKRSFADGRSQ